MKVLILLSVLTVLVSANYDTASKYYDAKEYQKAIDELKSSTEEYSNPKLHLLWAKSAEALGNKKEAMSAYERVSMLDSDSTQARIALLKIYKNSSREELAKEMSSELKNYQLTPQQRSSLEILKGDVQDYYKAKATLSIGHDTNINISAGSDELGEYYGYGTYKGELATLFARFNGSGSYVNELDEKGGWYARGDLNIYYQNNFDASLYNLFIGSIEAGMGYTTGNYSFYLPLGYDRVNYLEHDLLTQIRVTPKINIVLNRDYIMNVSLKYRSKDYIDSAYKGMNDSSFGLSSGLYYLFDKNYAYVNLQYEEFSASESKHKSYIDKNIITLTSGVNYNALDWLVTRLDYKYKTSDYKDSLLRDTSKKRADDYHQLELKLSHYFAENLEFFVSDRYIQNSSNYLPADYSKNIFMFGVSANY